MAKSPSTISQIKPNESNVAYAALGSERRTVWLDTPCAFAVAGTLDEVQSVAICKTCGALSGSGVFFVFLGKLVVDISQGCRAFTYELAEFKHFVLYSGKTNGFMRDAAAHSCGCVAHGPVGRRSARNTRIQNHPKLQF